MRNNLQKNQELEVWDVVSVNKQRKGTNRSQNLQKYNSSRNNNYRKPSHNTQRNQNRRQSSYSSSRSQNNRQQYYAREAQGRNRQHSSGNQQYQRGRTPNYNNRQNTKATAYRKRAIQSTRRKKAQKRRGLLFRSIELIMIVLCLVGAFMLPGTIFEKIRQSKAKEITPPIKDMTLVDNTKEEQPIKMAAPMITVDYLEVNEYSRPGTELNKINNIFVHYTANPKTSAKQNRSYFSNLAETHERSASAHFIIGYTGEIIQCIPMDEQAYAVVGRNEDSVSIECCYIQKDGQFTQETYDSLIKLLAWLMQEYNLESKDILRHYDCGGKRCPLYYVNHEDAWIQLLKDVDNYIENFEAENALKEDNS